MDGIFKKHLFLHPLTQSLTHLSYLEDVYCLLIDGLLTFFKSIIFISAATFYVGAYQITPKHLHCFTHVSMIYRLYLFQTTHKCPACKKVVGKYSGNGQWAQPFWLNQAKPSLTEGFGGKVQRQWPVSEAILAQMTKPNKTRFVSLFFFFILKLKLFGGGHYIHVIIFKTKPN